MLIGPVLQRLPVLFHETDMDNFKVICIFYVAFGVKAFFCEGREGMVWGFRDQKMVGESYLQTRKKTFFYSVQGLSRLLCIADHMDFLYSVFKPRKKTVFRLGSGGDHD